MKYVTLGRTGLQVSQLSFGGIPIQRADAANTKAVVDKLEEYGINYIDTARGYTVSEEYLGAALEGRRDKFILATKSMSRDRESMARDIETSLSNLRTGFIDLYQLHNLPEKDIGKVFGPGGAWEALAEAKAAGKIGHIGVTAHSADALKILVEQYSDRLETVMFPYNIVEDQGRDVLALAREKGMGTIAMKPLAGGNLDDYALALRYIAASGVCDVMIPGMGSPEEVDRNAAVDLETPFTEAELEQCAAVRKELGTQFCRRCNYCPLPQRHRHPQLLPHGQLHQKVRPGRLGQGPLRRHALPRRLLRHVRRLRKALPLWPAHPGHADGRGQDLRPLTWAGGMWTGACC